MTTSTEHILKHAPALIGVAAADGRFVHVSNEWEAFLGLPLSEIEGQDFLRFVHPEDRQATLDALSELGHGEPVLDFENRYQSAGGDYRRLSWRSDLGPDGLIYFSAVDITEARGLRDTLEASNARLSQVAEIAGIGGWEVDLINNTVFWDETTRRIHEVPDDFVPNLEAGVNFYDGEAAQKIGEAVQRGIEDGQPWDVVLPLITFTGRRIFVRASGKPLMVDGVVTRLTGTFQDVTEAQEYAEQLEKSRAAAQSANEAKSRFLANMSHEIRTPLNGVLGMAQLLQRTQLDEKQAFYLQTLRDSGTALSSLVDDVLDLARIEAGEVRLVAEPYDLADVVSTSRSAVAAQAAEKSILLTVSVSPALPETATGDAARLKQVLINLLGNAVKFTDSGRVVLTAEPGDAGFMRIQVSDTGPGVPDALKGAIFERFTQADSSSTRRQGGAGLGLAICQDLVDLAGGRIGVEDAPGGGARFWFDWPLGADAAVTADTPARRPARSAGTVLVAEDNMVSALLLQEALSEAGYEVLHARNGREAVELALSAHPDAILIDVHMPELNGLEAIETIRRRAPAPAPFIVLTADVTEETRKLVDRAGPHEAFNKPVDIDALVKAVTDVITPSAEATSA